jgi:dynein heavy chain
MPPPAAHGPQDIEDRLRKYEELAELYNNREEIFELPRTEYDQVDAIRKIFEPYANLWKVRRHEPPSH